MILKKNFKWNMRARVRIRVNIKVNVFVWLVKRVAKWCFITYLNISTLDKNLQKSSKKSQSTFGGNMKKLYLCTRNRERCGLKLKYWNKDEVLNLTAWKNKFSKKLAKSFGSSKISLTFASAFKTKAFKEEFFERFRYEQASSTRLLI